MQSAPDRRPVAFASVDLVVPCSHGSLTSLGFSGVSVVRQGKLFYMTSARPAPDAARLGLPATCEKLLAVIEN